jgi:hypothetical protein
MTLSIMTECCYGMSLKLCVTYEPFMLSVAMLNVIILSVVVPIFKLSKGMLLVFIA